MIGPERLVVTVLGAALIVAVNLYFFARPPGRAGGQGRGPRSPGARPGRAGGHEVRPVGRDSPGRDTNLPPSC